VDYGEAHKRSRSVATRQTKRIGILMKNHHVVLYNGVGRLVTTREVEIEPSGERLTARNILVATGARPRPLPDSPFDGNRVINYRAALDLREIPSSTVIVGAGPIGMLMVAKARLLGAGKIIALDTFDKKLDMAMEFGADVTFNVGKMDDQALVQAVKDETEGHGAVGFSGEGRSCARPGPCAQGRGSIRSWS